MCVCVCVVSISSQHKPAQEHSPWEQQESRTSHLLGQEKEPDKKLQLLPLLS